MWRDRDGERQDPPQFTQDGVRWQCVWDAARAADMSPRESDHYGRAGMSSTDFFAHDSILSLDPVDDDAIDLGNDVAVLESDLLKEALGFDRADFHALHLAVFVVRHDARR